MLHLRFCRSCALWMVFVAHAASKGRTSGDGLALLAADPLAHDAHALPLVGFGRIEAADLGGDGAHQLFVRALDLETNTVADGDLDPLRDEKKDRVRISEREIQLLALERGLEAHSLDLEVLGVTNGDALDHAV